MHSSPLHQQSPTLDLFHAFSQGIWVVLCSLSYALVLDTALGLVCEKLLLGAIPGTSAGLRLVRESFHVGLPGNGDTSLLCVVMKFNSACF